MTTCLTDFASLSLPVHVLANLTQLGYTQMTRIQAASLPVVHQNFCNKKSLTLVASLLSKVSRREFST
jgi:superfamily II DNA/RNA helicase